MTFKAAVASIAKTRKQPRNEDGFAMDVEEGIFAVFDGVGGASNSDYASSFAADFVLKEFKQIPNELRHNSTFLERWLIETVNAIHLALVQKNDEEDDTAGQTTASILVVNDNPTNPEVLIINVGDSRIYGWNKDKHALIQLTIDDSTFPDPRLDEIESEKELTDSMRYKFNLRFYISKALGVENIGELNVAIFPLENFDAFLLTSDGVHDNLSRKEIANFLLKPIKYPEALISDLVDFAKARSEDLTHIRHKSDDITAMFILKPG